MTWRSQTMNTLLRRNNNLSQTRGQVFLLLSSKKESVRFLFLFNRAQKITEHKSQDQKCRIFFFQVSFLSQSCPQCLPLCPLIFSGWGGGAGSEGWAVPFRVHSGGKASTRPGQSSHCLILLLVSTLQFLTICQFSYAKDVATWWA